MGEIEKNKDVVKLIDSLYEMCDTLEGFNKYDNIKLRDIAWHDFLAFLVYIGKIGGEISPKRRAFIAIYFEFDVYLKEHKALIDEGELYANSFLTEVPFSFRMFVDIDNNIYGQNNDMQSVVKIYIKELKAISDLFCMIEDNNTEQEEHIINKYLNMLKKYYKNNTERNGTELDELILDDTDYVINIDGRIIRIPKALPETIKRMQELVRLRDEMIFESEKAIKNYDPDDTFASPECCYSKLDDILQRYNEEYKEELVEKYEDCKWFYSFPDYMTEYQEICQAASDRIASLYREQNERRELGASIAEREARKKIKGMRFGVVTNSLTSALLYTGISAVTRASQEWNAEQTYQKILDRYCSNDAQIQEMKIVSKEIFPLIYPVSEKTTAKFLEDLLEKIDLYEEIGYEQLSDIHKTQSLVDDSNYIYGDTPALRSAINKLQKINGKNVEFSTMMDIVEECPYCPEVYFKLIDMDILNKDIFKIAKVLNISDLIIPKLENYLKKNDLKKSISALEIIALYKDKTLNEIIKTFYGEDAKKVENSYKELMVLKPDNRYGMKCWIRKVFDEDVDVFENLSENDIKTDVRKWIENIVDIKTYDMLLNVGMIKTENIRLSNSNQKEISDINEEYISMLTPLVLSYVKETVEKKNAYEKAYKTYNAGKEERENIIEKKKGELALMSFFSFSKKKVLREEIEKLENELKEYKKTEPIALRTAYFDM